VRIIAGSLKGRRLTPLGKGDDAAHLRPTPDRVRESLFSMLTHLGRLPGARVLDLFAGTGALSFEALSRGAATALLVDNGRLAAKLIAQNIALTGLEQQARHFKQDATRLGTCASEPFDLIFLDPPYGKGLGASVLAGLVSGNWLAPKALIIWEENSPQAAPPGFNIVDQRRFGTTHVTLLCTAVADSA